MAVRQQRQSSLYVGIVLRNPTQSITGERRFRGGSKLLSNEKIPLKTYKGFEMYKITAYCVSCGCEHADHEKNPKGPGFLKCEGCVKEGKIDSDTHSVCNTCFGKGHKNHTFKPRKAPWWDTPLED